MALALDQKPATVLAFLFPTAAPIGL